MNFEINNNIGRFISHISRRSSLFISKELSKINCNIPPSQISFLVYLYKNEFSRQDILGSTLSFDKGNVTKILKKMEEDNLIFKKKDDFDKRVFNIFLTEKALSLKPTIFLILENCENFLKSNLNDKEYLTLLSLLNKIENSTKKI